MAERRDVEIGDQHADDRREGDAARDEVALVERDPALAERIHLGIEGRRDVQVGMFRSGKACPWLPVIDKKFMMIVIEEAILVHSGFHAPRSGSDGPTLDDREDMFDVEKESAWPTRCRS